MNQKIIGEEKEAAKCFTAIDDHGPISTIWAGVSSLWDLGGWYQKSASVEDLGTGFLLHSSLRHYGGKSEGNTYLILLPSLTHASA